MADEMLDSHGVMPWDQPPAEETAAKVEDRDCSEAKRARVEDRDCSEAERARVEHRDSNCNDNSNSNTGALSDNYFGAMLVIIVFETS